MEVSLDKAILHGVKYLTEFIKINDTWKDFYIEEVGISDQWVTAYVGKCLLDSKIILSDEMKKALVKAAYFIISTKKANGGWGFNSLCRSDCDSSVHAVLFLKKMGCLVDEKSYRYIESFRQSDGGFATYLEGPMEAWKVSHVDVTTYAQIALSGWNLKQRSEELKTKKYMDEWFIRYNLPPAYWWQSEFYTSLSAFYCYQKCGFSFPKENLLTQCLNKAIPESAFEAALMLELIFQLDKSQKIIKDLLIKILNSQNSDGSFKGGSILRVTQNDSYKSWENANSYKLIEDNCVFTTAVVLRVLGIINYEKIGRKLD